MKFIVKSNDGKIIEEIDADEYDYTFSRIVFYKKWQDFISIWHFKEIASYPKNFYSVREVS